MNLLSLRYFVEVARTLSFTEASRELHVSQPGISQQIHQLEEELGAKLLYRTTRKVELTEEGKYLYETAGASFEKIEQTFQAVRDSAALPSLIKIATIPSAASLFLPAIMNEVHRNHPDIEFSLKETTSVQAAELIKSRVYHIGFIRTPFESDTMEKEGLEFMEFQRRPLRAVISSRHRLAGRGRISLTELANDAFLHYDPIQSPAIHRLMQKACEQAGFRPKTVCSGSELLTISYLVGNNFGVTLMPADMFELIESDRVCSLELDDVNLESSISAVWEDSPYMGASTKRIVSFLKKMKSQQPFGLSQSPAD